MASPFPHGQHAVSVATMVAWQDDSAIPPPIAMDDLTRRCLGKVSFAAALLEELEATGKQRVDEIAMLTASDDPQATAEAAHSLKGAAAIMCAEPLRLLAAEIEAIGDTGETAALSELVRKLRQEMDRCLAYISHIRNSTE